ncbi:MAG: response regulator transcription factor, partial [Bosea sp. (in: a-proteobacteria)]
MPGPPGKPGSTPWGRPWRLPWRSTFSCITAVQWPSPDRLPPGPRRVAPDAGSISPTIGRGDRAMRLIMAEPQTLVRAGLIRLLEQQAGAEVIGEADDGQQLLELAGRLHPDVVVSELALGRMSGLEMLSQLRRHYPEIAVLMISSQLDSHSVRTALKLGAAGFLGKSA